MILHSLRRLEQGMEPVETLLAQALVADALRLQECPVVFVASIDSAGAPSQSAVDTIAPFLTPKGLEKLNVSGTDVFFASPAKALSPNEAHNALIMYLRDDYRFSKTFHIYGFLTPLSNATTSNTTWSSEDGQLFLNAFAVGNGLLRINDILRWSPISIKAGSDSEFFSSEMVIKSTLSHVVNALYTCIMNNCDIFFEKVEACVDNFMEARSFKDPKIPSSSLDCSIGHQVMASLSSILFECLTRFKNSTATHPMLCIIVRRLGNWLDIWLDGVSASPGSFDDPFKNIDQTARGHITDFLKNKVGRLVRIVDREQHKHERAAKRAKDVLHLPLGTNLDEGVISALSSSYNGPGTSSYSGQARHDNDFVNIEDIRVVPTNDELLSTIAPFLPANIYGAPHPHPVETMQRLLDTQFRLLREELTAPLRTSVQLVREDFLHPRNGKEKNVLQGILKNNGGRYRGSINSQESIMFNIYTGVKFSSLVAERRGLSVALSFDAPPGRARAAQPKSRRVFWEGMSGKRLMQGGLVALVWKRGNEVDVHMGILASSVKEVADSAQTSKDRVSARVVFFDTDIELRILNVINDPNQLYGTVIMVESSVMFEAIRPFLDALQRVEPEAVPFSQYLVHCPSGYFPGFGVLPPRYARTPGFTYQLAPLFPAESNIDDLKLDVSDPESILHARHQLKQSRLDPSQAEAVVDALTREVALIQGPPGTGKSFTGIELLRVLVKSAKPVLMIAFTNHALDHLLTGVLDAGITNKVVRLGGRSADERIKRFSIEELEEVAGHSHLDKSLARNHRNLKTIKEEIHKLMKTLVRDQSSSDAITDYLASQFPEHSEHIQFPPPWISAVHASSVADEAAGWQTVGNLTSQPKKDFYSFWKRGDDLAFLSRMENPPAPDVPLPPSAISHPANKFALLQEVTMGDDRENISDSNNDGDEDEELQPWEISWASSSTSAANVPTPANYEAPSAPIVQDVVHLDSNIQASAGLNMSDLQDPAVFFATHGLEAIPAVPFGNRSLDDLLNEGDVWTFSADERRTLHAFWNQCVREQTYQNKLGDFERLRKQYKDGLEVEIEGKNEVRRQLLASVDIIGCTTTGAAKLTSLLKGLGPRIMLVEEAGQVLEAHVLGSLVSSIEHVILIGDPLQLRPTLNNYSLSVDSKQGSKIYKFDMSLMERLSSSGFPMSQIDVQRRMRPQGCYSHEGDIVVLCAYLGQLARVRDALADLVAVVIDERDQAELNDRESEEELIDATHVEHVKVAKKVRLRTIDNYQGEEAKIIILSLVRNAGNLEDVRQHQPTIGFLKSDNRTNGGRSLTMRLSQC
ncbi:hypothetical protein H0H92_000616 [Tricholoma furcatifolium]|nr:hypothetical protein H0H92_000616 [Tricholoma furcatifolium]